MKFQDALLAGPEHGTDRLPVEIDRRLRRRLGLESASRSSSSRVWLRPAIAAFAVAAIVIVVIALRPSHSSDPQRVAAGFVDVSKSRWSGTVTSDQIDVRADSPASATVTWANATIVAARGTRLSTTPSGLSLAQGSIQIQRTESKPMSVVVPMGRVEIASYRSSITADRQSVTLLIDDGTGNYIDPDGQAHALVPNTMFVWPPAAGQPQQSITAPHASTPEAPEPPRKASGHTSVRPGPGDEVPQGQGPPGLTPPSVPRRPDTPCTYKSDCDPGQTCRENENRESVCMGNGAEGAPCWFDNDCLSQHCEERRCASPRKN